jgi:hypothetical protein
MAAVPPPAVLHDVNPWQVPELETTERVASVFSLLGCAFIFFTFLFSNKFGKPINRLVFYACWGNITLNVATLMARAGINLGANSALCQIQGFLIQMYAQSVIMVEFG